MSEPRESQLLENVPLDGDTNEARQALKKKKATTPGNPRPSTSKHQDTSPVPDISEPERPNCGQNKRKVNSREVVSEQEVRLFISFQDLFFCMFGGLFKTYKYRKFKESVRIGGFRSKDLPYKSCSSRGPLGWRMTH